jgi:hypothetical protein
LTDSSDGHFAPRCGPTLAAIECLKTDIGIVIFVTTITAMMSMQGIALIPQSIERRISPEDAAKEIVGTMEAARSIDWAGRADPPDWRGLGGKIDRD